MSHIKETRSVNLDYYVIQDGHNAETDVFRKTITRCRTRAEKTNTTMHHHPSTKKKATHEHITCPIQDEPRRRPPSNTGTLLLVESVSVPDSSSLFFTASRRSFLLGFLRRLPQPVHVSLLNRRHGLVKPFTRLVGHGGADLFFPVGGAHQHHPLCARGI